MDEWELRNVDNGADLPLNAEEEEMNIINYDEIVNFRTVVPGYLSVAEANRFPGLRDYYYGNAPLREQRIQIVRGGALREVNLLVPEHVPVNVAEPEWQRRFLEYGQNNLERIRRARRIRRDVAEEFEGEIPHPEILNRNPEWQLNLAREEARRIAAENPRMPRLQRDIEAEQYLAAILRTHHNLASEVQRKLIEAIGRINLPRNNGEALRDYRRQINIQQTVGRRLYNKFRKSSHHVARIIAARSGRLENEDSIRRKATRIMGTVIGRSLQASLNDLIDIGEETRRHPLHMTNTQGITVPVSFLPVLGFADEVHNRKWAITRAMIETLSGHDPVATIANALMNYDGEDLQALLEEFFEALHPDEQPYGMGFVGSDLPVDPVHFYPIEDNLDLELRFIPSRIRTHGGRVNMRDLSNSEPSEAARNFRRRPRRRGGWAPFTCKFKGLNLSRLQIETSGEGFKNSALPCLIYACKQSGKFSDEELAEMMRFNGQGYTLIVSLKKIGAHFNTLFKVASEGGHTKTYGPPDSDRVVELGLLDEHIFINEPLPVSMYAIRNWESVYAKFGHGRVVKEGRREVEKEDVSIPAMQCLKLLKKQNAFEPLSWTDHQAVTQDYLQFWAFDKESLNYDTTFCPPFKILEPESFFIPEQAIFYADFESCTEGDIHLPYLFCIVGKGNCQHVAYHSPDTCYETWKKDFIGTLMRAWSEQEKQFGNTMGSIMYIYFHNLDYDSAFVLKFIGSYCIGPLITNCNNVLGYDVKIPNFTPVIRFRDSLRYITAPLSKFGKMFNLEIEKEIFPYDFYTAERLNGLVDGKYGSVFEFLGYARPGEAEELSQRIVHYRHPQNDQLVHVINYAIYYCIRDCQVLQHGFSTFRKQLITFTKLDPCKYYTISSMAYNTLNLNHVFDSCFQLSGPPLFFIRKCVNGGRCMLRQNKKVIAEGPIADFDAVSLYPSAMAKLWTVQGHPKVIPPEWDIATLRRNANDFFIEVEIKRVPRHLDFPLLPRNVDGFKTYNNEPVESIFIDNIWLEDLQTFHQIGDDDIVLKRGYYYNEGRNYTIQTVIRTLFEQRLAYKREGNPLQEIVKLLMNSCYGKSILKPVLFDKLVVSEERLGAILMSMRSALVGFSQIDGSDNYVLKENVKLRSVKGFPTFGVQVLSMSKRIMSEVMVTAQECGIPVYYTDTDSMHLPEQRLGELREAYRLKYHRELIGKQMGQFHSDFSVPGQDGDWYSEKFIGVGKKCYLDILRDRNDPSKKEYHIRIKGVPIQAFMAKAAEVELLPEELMLSLYNDEEVDFDLLAGGRVSFGRTRGLAKYSRTEFHRKLQFLERFTFTVRDNEESEPGSTEDEWEEVSDQGSENQQ